MILHELVHVRRHDLLAQVAAQAACCLYWFHPMVWLAARQLRKEREAACDDAVLSGGVSAPDYAGHLLEVARVMVQRRSLADAPAMAENGDLEERVRAVLDRGQESRAIEPPAGGNGGGAGVRAVVAGGAGDAARAGRKRRARRSGAGSQQGARPELWSPHQEPGSQERRSGQGECRGRIWICQRSGGAICDRSEGDADLLWVRRKCMVEAGRQSAVGGRTGTSGRFPKQ